MIGEQHEEHLISLHITLSKRVFGFFSGFSASLLWFEMFYETGSFGFSLQTEDTLISCLLLALPGECFVSVSIYCSF